ncbi:hypothetical protein [Veillonella agrestimuris]|uniref:hypothetical protein n=1 Tax=Veillonella agrestimuris TaxID=2941340 RepID=UPI00203E6C4F|nr:hypothetical protein [Veillonella agrestimuris]
MKIKCLYKQIALTITISALTIIPTTNDAQTTLPNQAQSTPIQQVELGRFAYETTKYPSSIHRQLAESKPNIAIENAIQQALQIPTEALINSRYMYNYVDLNGDGTQEVLAIVMGPYTSGTGGHTLLWIVPTKDTWQVSQVWSLVRTPIIITTKAINNRPYGARGILTYRSGGGATPSWVLLKNSHGEYDSVNNGTELMSLTGIEGTAIMADRLSLAQLQGRIHSFQVAN